MGLQRATTTDEGEVVPFYTDALFASLNGLQHRIFTRHGGVSAIPYNSLNVSSSIGDDPLAVRQNRDRVMRVAGRPRESLVMGGLVHGTEIALVDRHSSGRSLDGGGMALLGVDALISNDPSVTLLITAADCAQVLFFDPAQRAIGIAHAGWRGNAARILEKTVSAMTRAFGSVPDEMYALLGPSLGPCCARFSDPQHELPTWAVPYIDGHYVDLWAMQRAQLQDAGLPGAQISAANLCTVCHRHEFFSHRGDAGRSGRFAAVLALC